jgi:hypothetical protein
MLDFASDNLLQIQEDKTEEWNKYLNIELIPNVDRG